MVLSMELSMDNTMGSSMDYGCPWTIHVNDVEHRGPINVNKHSSSRYMSKI